MSSDRVEIVERMADALSCGDAEAVGFGIAEDFEWIPHVAGFTVKDAYRGGRGFRDWCRLVRAMFRGYSIEIEDTRELGDHVFATARQRGRVRVSRLVMDEVVTIACEFRDGRLHHARAYPAWASKTPAAIAGEAPEPAL